MLPLLLALAASPASAGRLPPDMPPSGEITWTSDDGWQGHVRHYPGPGQPLLMVHGMGANHYNFDYRPEVSLARYLQGRGWDVWVADLRGDPGTVAPSRRAARDYDFDDHALHDVPAIVDAVLAATGHDRLWWVGHSMGGMLLYTALGLEPDRIAGGVAIGSPARMAVTSAAAHWVEASRWMRFGNARMPGRLAGRLAAVLGPADPAMNTLVDPGHRDWPMERALMNHALTDLPRAMAREVVTWLDTGAFVRADGVTSWLPSPAPAVPLLVVAGSADRVAPAPDVTYACRVFSDCTAVVAGPASGMSGDYGHVDMVLGPTAPTEVWPVVGDWLAWEAGRAATPPALVTASESEAGR